MQGKSFGALSGAMSGATGQAGCLSSCWSQRLAGAITASLLYAMLSTVALADVTAPQAPPELSDTLTDFRTKEQLSEQVYIEGRSDPQNSLNVPTIPGDLEAKVMRLSATYLPQYEVAVPRNGLSILRFYDLNGYPLEIVSTKVENQGFLAEVTASPSELMIRLGADDPSIPRCSYDLTVSALKRYRQKLYFHLKAFGLDQSAKLCPYFAYRHDGELLCRRHQLRCA